MDSGAQMTIISPSCAEKCNMMGNLDEAFQGTAIGVGTAKILGRIHSSKLKIGNQYLPCSMTVLEGKDVDMLLGLDILKRYQACIDLGKNVLRINDEDIPFLSEHEIKHPVPPIESENPTHPVIKNSDEDIKKLMDMGVSQQEAEGKKYLIF